MPNRICWLICLVTTSLSMSAVVRGNTIQTVTLLEDFEVTGELSDVVHLGDGTNMTHYVRPDAQGLLYTSAFDIPYLPQGDDQVLVHLSLYEVDYTDNDIVLNGTSIGVLGQAPREHWVSQEFFALPELLQLSDNTLEIHSCRSPVSSNMDDFEFTNLYLAYNIPEPATLSLLGLGGLAVLRRRR